MGLSAVTYALAKKYTDNTVIGLGGLKGAPCKVKSIQKENGRSTVTLEWESNTGVIQTSEMYIDDGVTIWISGRDYEVNDIVINDLKFYICTEANSDIVFDVSKWQLVISDSSSDYDSLQNKPQINGHTITGNLSSQDLELADGDTITYDSNGKLAVPQISESDIDDLFN